MSSRTLKLGFVGVGDRGSYHLDAALGIEGVEVPALCDIDGDYLYRAKRWVEESGRPAPRLYDRGETDFERLCETEELDAVVCSTSWKWHAPICLAGMRNEKHVVCEVPLVLTVDEGWEVVETWQSTGYWATLAVEGFRNLHLNYMVRRGLFGEILHAEGGYVHDLRLVKFDPEREPWRLQHSVTRNGNLYPNHPMTNILPQLDVNHGDRIDFIVSMSSSAQTLNEYAAHYYGPRHPHATMKMAQGDTNVSLIRTTLGKFFTLNFDTNTPHPRGFYRLRGTKAVYWGNRYGFSPEDLIFMDGEEKRAEDFLPEFEHPVLKNYHPPERAEIRGHGGRINRTPLTWHRLVEALREERMPDWDVYDSVTTSVISPVTESSVALGSQPVDFPDYTRGEWKTRPPLELT